MNSPLNYLIVHGTGSHPQGNWFPWLQAELEGVTDGQVFVPAFPTPAGHNLTNWLKVAQAILPILDPARTVLIGHSTGAVFVLRLAELTLKPYKAVFAVCPFADDLGLPFDPLNDSFVHPEFNWTKTRNGAEAFYSYAGTDDPYVPLPLVHKVGDALGIRIKTIENGGHLNAEAGYHEFPALLADIKRIKA